jgi:hypothetical protein
MAAAIAPIRNSGERNASILLLAYRRPARAHDEVKGLRRFEDGLKRTRKRVGLHWARADVASNTPVVMTWRDSSRTLIAALVAVWIAVPVAFAWGVVRSRSTALPEPRITDRPIQVASNGYAASPTCQACHPSQYRTWHSSYHRTMTQVATPETVVSSFDGVRGDASCGRSSTTQTGTERATRRLAFGGKS